MAIYEMKWACPYCDTENAGPNKACKNSESDTGCGRARPDDVEFYLPRGTAAVISTELLREAESGPDWYCSHCNGGNEDKVDGVAVTHCKNCRNERDISDTDHPMIEYTLDAVPTTDQEAKALVKARNASSNKHERIPQPSQRPRGQEFVKSKASDKNSGSKMLWVTALLAVSAVFWLIYHFFIASNTTDLRVTSVGWSRYVEVQVLREVSEGDWSLPSGARSVSSTRKIKSYQDVQTSTETKSRVVTEKVKTGDEQYKCGTISLGNGYAKDKMCARPVYRDVRRTETYTVPAYTKKPIYDTWHEYKIDKWVHADTYKSSGLNQNPAWPTYQTTIGQRVSSRGESYWLMLFDDDGNSFKHVTTLEEWKTYKVGQKLRAEVTRAGSTKILDQGMSY